jgi:hypothetical protein
MAQRLHKAGLPAANVAKLPELLRRSSKASC